MLLFLYRIGYAIAKRLAVDGAQVVISSRKQEHVDKAVAELKKENLSVHGSTCNVGKKDDRTRLIEEVWTLKEIEIFKYSVLIIDK